MTEFYSTAIDISKIKFRWEEPYASEAGNRQMSAFPPGIYRGGQSGPMAVPSKSFRVGPDIDGSSLFQDSLYVVFDEAAGFAVAILDTSTLTFDMTARFSGGGGTIPSDITWWAWVEADYATGVPTSATYKVADSSPPAGAVVLAKINMLTGNTTIETSNFDESARTLPLPTKRKDGAYVSGDQWYGVLSGEEAWNIPTSDHKEAMNNAATAPTASNPFVTKADSSDKYFAEATYVPKTIAPAATKFQLNGWFYVGKGTGSEAIRYFSLRRSENGGRLPLYVSPGGDEHFITGIIKADESGAVNPATDADAQGFYANPWIYFSPSYTGYLLLFCYEKKMLSTVDQAPAKMIANAGAMKYPHATNVINRSQSSTPDSLTSLNVNSSLAELLSYINARVKTNYPSAAAPVTWTKVWQSDQLAEGSQDENSITIYFKSGEWMLVVGASFNGTLMKGPTSVGFGVDASMLYLGGAGFYIGKKTAIVTPDDTWDPFDEDEWSSVIYNDNSALVNFYGGGMSSTDSAIWMRNGAYLRGATPSSGTLDDWLLIYDTGQQHTKIYYGLDGADCRFAITKNAYWHQGSGKWRPFLGTANSFVLEVGPDGIVLLKEDKDDPLHEITTGWTHAQWTSKIVFMGDPDDLPGGLPADFDPAYACGVVSGDMYERFVIAQSAQQGLAAGGVLWKYDPISFRNKWAVAPSNIVFSESTSDNNNGSYPVSATLVGHEKWGFYVHGRSTSVSAGGYWDWLGAVEVY